MGDVTDIFAISGLGLLVFHSAPRGFSPGTLLLEIFRHTHATFPRNLNVRRISVIFYSEVVSQNKLGATDIAFLDCLFL